MKAMGNNIVVLQDPPVDKVDNWFFLTSELNPTKDVQSGTVMSVGTGYIDPRGKKHPIDPEVQIGVKVAYTNRTILKNNKRYNINEFIEDGKTYVNVDVGDILGLFLEENNMVNSP